MSKELKELFCSEHCVCLEMVFSKKKSIQLAEEIKKMTPKEEIRKVGVRAALRFSMGRHFVKKRRYRFIASIDAVEEGAKIDETVFSRIFPFAQKAFDVLNQYDIKKYNGTSCTTFIFSHDRFSVAGELVLPGKLTLRPEVVRKLGETELSGFYLSFKKSPLGLDTLRVLTEDGRLEIRPKIEFKLTTTKNCVEDSFKHAKEVSLLFVEEKK